MCAPDSLLLSRAAAESEIESSELLLMDLAAEAAVGIDSLEVEEDAVGFIRLSPSGGRPAGGASLGIDVFPIAEGETGPSSLTVPNPNGFWVERFRDALQSLAAGAGAATGTVVGKDPSVIGASTFGGAIVGTALIGGATEAPDFRLGSPSDDLGRTVAALIGETIPSSTSSSSSCQLELPGEFSELDPVCIVDIVFSSVILLSDFHRVVFGSFGNRLPPEGFKADRLAKALFPGVPGAFRRGVPWGRTPLTRATALLIGMGGTWKGLFPLVLGKEEEEGGDGLPSAGCIEPSLMGDKRCLLGDMRSSRLLNAGATRSGRLPVKAITDL